MPQIAHIATVAWPFDTNMMGRLAWYSSSRRAFVAGTNSAKWAFPADDPTTPLPLAERSQSSAIRNTAYDELLPSDDYSELAAWGIDGFQFLSKQQYDQAFGQRSWGSTCPVDQTLISGLASELPVRHPASGAILSFGFKRAALHELASPGLTKIAQVKPKSDHAITAFCAVPNQNAIYYGTNGGDIVLLPITARELGRHETVLKLGQTVNTIRASADASRLFIGRLGCVALVAVESGQFRVVSQQCVACRALELLGGRWLLANQGIHGLTLFDTSGDKLAVVASQKLSNPVDLMVCSADSRHSLVFCTHSKTMGFYRIE